MTDTLPAPTRNCRIPKTHKYTRKGVELMCLLGELWGLSNTAVVEIAVRRWAKDEGFDLNAPAQFGSDTEFSSWPGRQALTKSQRSQK